MAWHVDFEVDLDSALGAKFLNCMQVRYAPDLGIVVRTFFGKFGKSRDFEGPGLGVCGMEVEAIEFVEG